MNVTEDVVLGTRIGNNQKEILVTHIPVQIGVGWAVGDEEVNTGRDSGFSIP